MNPSSRHPGLQVIDGGRSLPVSQMHRIFLDGYVTDTRLMGVLVIGAHWNIAAPGANRNDPDSWEELYQFFYIDCEEAGFETYQQVRGEDVDDGEAERAEEALICGLGGRKVSLDERQLRLLLQNWQGFNEAHGLPLPARQEDYGFLLSPAIEADAREQFALMQLLCSPIRSDAQTVNYFLMRCFGRDYEGALYLTDAGNPDGGGQYTGHRVTPAPGGPEGPGQPLYASFDLDLYEAYECATFCRNLIDVKDTLPDGAVCYRCESLIEMDGAYELVISLVTVRSLRVVGFEHGSRMPISSTEAAMILKKVEYITVYEVFLSEEELEDNIDEFTLGFHTTMSEYENGRLFMRFRPTNDHVDSRRFLLSGDVEGMYFLTHGGQLIVCAHTLPDVRTLELTIARSVLAPYLIPSGRYNFVPGRGRTPGGTYAFREPVLYEFMNSDYEHFEEFVEMLRGE